MKILKYSALIIMTCALWGCSKGNPDAAVTIDPATKKHPAGWAANGTGGLHPDAYFADAASCEGCHGDPTDPAGGISKVSCSNPGRSGVACHAKFPHIDNFADYLNHGAQAKKPAAATDGFAHCQKCHGTDYRGRGLAKDCIGCHKTINSATNAPHAANWLSGANVNGVRHSSTHRTNSPACFQCHAGGQNNKSTGGALRPAPPAAAAGATPDCFNNTLCHDSNVGHPAGWTAVGGPGIHGGTAKSSLTFCQSCHALPASGINPRFTGGTTFTSCESCHNRPFIAHPQTWVPGRGNTSGIANTTSSHGAGTVGYADCSICHGAAGNTTAPSCISAKGKDGVTGCHSAPPITVAAIPVSVGCGSCHLVPPTSGAHAKHTVLAGIGCSDCHLGAGSGTVKHANGTIDVAFNPVLQSKTGGTIGINGTKQCANVSCHGGKLTLAWATVVANYSLNCNNCHAGASTFALTQYNNYYSGQHGFHVTNAAICVQCHTMVSNNHFTDLKGQSTRDQIALSVRAAGTIVPNAKIVTYTSSPTPPTPPRSCVTLFNSVNVINNTGTGSCHTTQNSSVPANATQYVWE